MTQSRSIPCLLGFFLALAAPASAVTLAEYQFTNPAETITEATYVAPNVEAQDAAWVGYSSGAGFSSSTNTAYVSSASTGSELDSEEYLEITLLASESYQLDLESISFDLGGSNSNSTTDYTVFCSVRSDAEVVPYSTDLVFTNESTVATKEVPANTPGTSPVFNLYTISTAGSEFESKEVVTFRIYLWDEAGSNLTDRVTNITLTGDVTPVPEGSSSTMLVLGLLAVAGRMIMRRRKA